MFGSERKHPTQREIMKRRIAIGMSIMAALVLALLSGPAVSQPKSLKSQLVGTWMLVSSEVTAANGTKTQSYGPNPLGMIVYDASGHLIVIEEAPNLPKVASNNRMTETPAEAKAITQASQAYFGTYTVNEAAKTYALHVEGSTYPNNIGVTGSVRTVKYISADQLVLSIPQATGGTSLTVWKRAK
jgi:hypothetical protein